MTSKTTRMPYEPALDGLRAIAVIAVVIYHAFPQFLPGGGEGVDVFFVLSGYLITRLLLEERKETGRIDIRSFYIRRILRLTPALWCMLGFVVAIALVSKYRIPYLQSVAVSATYLMNWNRAFGWWPEYPLGHTWSLAMEEQFYLIWPFALVMISARRPLLWISGAAIASLAWNTWLGLHGVAVTRTYNGFDTHAYVILIGCAAALVHFPESGKSFLARLWLLPVALIAAIFMFSDSVPQIFTLYALPVALSLASAVLILQLQKASSSQRLFSWAPLTMTGKLSYGIYLWHFPLLNFFTSHLRHGAILSIVATYLIAAASYFTVERYFRRIKHRFEVTKGASERACEMDKTPLQGLS